MPSQQRFLFCTNGFKGKHFAQQSFCSRVLLPCIKLIKYEGNKSCRFKSVAGACVAIASSIVCTIWNVWAEIGSKRFVAQQNLKSLVQTRELCSEKAFYRSVLQEHATSCVPALKPKHCNIKRTKDRSAERKERKERKKRSRKQDGTFQISYSVLLL